MDGRGFFGGGAIFVYLGFCLGNIDFLKQKKSWKNLPCPFNGTFEKWNSTKWIFAGILAFSFREAISLDHYHKVRRRNGLATGNNYSREFFRALQLHRHRLGPPTLGDRYRGIAYKTISDD